MVTVTQFKNTVAQFKMYSQPPENHIRSTYRIAFSASMMNRNWVKL